MKSWILVASLMTCGFASGQKIAFEVVSVKPAEPSPDNMIRMGVSNDSGMARYTNFSVRDLIRVAYRVKDFQIEGPQSMAQTRFNVVGKLPEGASKDQIPEMLQAMLADRFKLELHHITRDHAIYALVVAGKSGPKLKAAEIPTAAPSGGPNAGGPAGPPRGGMMTIVENDTAHLKAPAATLSQVGEMISRFSDRPVLDMTGIEGVYEWDLMFSSEVLQNRGGRGMGMGGGDSGGERPADAPGSAAGSIYDSVKRYGLKLDPRKAALDILVVDRVEGMPTEN